MTVVTILLGFASGLSIGFIIGRVFERIEWQHRFDKFVEKNARREP